MIDFQKNIKQAANKIAPYIRKTPLIKANLLSHLLEAEIYLKLENTQVTSSFKVRGAFNKMLSLDKKQCEKGVVAASTGNHGAAVAYAGKVLGIKTKIFVPKTTAESKVESITIFGSELEFYGDDCSISESYAQQYAKQNGLTYISPYNDIQIVEGQGTIGLELSEQLPELDQVYVSVGGGGLISGISAFLKSFNKQIQIVGCLPENSPVMYECIKQGKIVDVDIKPTLSDSTAGNIDHDSITFDLCRQYVDEYVLASETQIKDALLMLLEKEHLLVEGSAALCLAAAIKQREKIKGKKIVLVMCGSNIDKEKLKSILG